MITFVREERDENKNQAVCVFIIIIEEGRIAVAILPQNAYSTLFLENVKKDTLPRASREYLEPL